MTYPHSTTAANICRARQMRKGYDNPGRVSFQMSLYLFCHSQILADLSTCSTERDRFATQHSMRNCVDHPAALYNIGYTIRFKFGLPYTFIHQSRGNDSITLIFSVPWHFCNCCGFFLVFEILNFRQIVSTKPHLVAVSRGA